MKFAVALKEALKYHAVAFVPNLIGGVIVAVTLWIGVIDPAIAALPGAAGGPEGMLESLLAAQYNIPVVLIGVIGGVAIRRLGKTALLFKIHGTAVVDVVDEELIEDDADSTHSVGDSDHRSTGENDVIESDTAAVDAETGDEPADDTTDTQNTVDTETGDEPADDTTDTQNTVDTETGDEPADDTTDTTDTTAIDADDTDSETDRQDTDINHDGGDEEDVSR